MRNTKSKKPLGVMIILIALLGIAFLLIYIKAQERAAKASPWVVYVAKENRVAADKYDGHMPCLKKIGAPYKIDDEGNLLIRSGYAGKAADLCS